MLHTSRSLNGMTTSPHHLASQAGLDVLKSGGNAIEGGCCNGCLPGGGLSAHDGNWR